MEIFMSITGAAEEILKHMFFISYFVQLHSNKIRAFFDSINKINAMNLNNAWKLDLKI